VKSRNDVTSRFSLDVVDHRELLDLFEIRFGTCWNVSRSEIAFPAALDFSVKVRRDRDNGRIVQITRGSKLSNRDLDVLLEQIAADLLDKRIAEYGIEILFAHRPVAGSFRSAVIPLQISPPPDDAPRAPWLHADHPFTLTYPLRACRTPQIRMRRRYKNAVEWAWVLNGLLRGSIKYHGPRPRNMWAIKSGAANEGCFWAQEFYIVEGREAFAAALNDPGTPLPVVAADVYFGDLRKRASAWLSFDTFTVPDNLDTILGAFVGLKGPMRRQFMQAAATIYVAARVWEVSVSAHLVACVQAIESLIERPAATTFLRFWRKRPPGLVKQFRDFCEQFGEGAEIDPKTLDTLYDVRSALVHGRYLFELDSAPWGGVASSVARSHEHDAFFSALSLAKTVLRNWLLATAGAEELS